MIAIVSFYCTIVFDCVNATTNSARYVLLTSTSTSTSLLLGTRS